MLWLEALTDQACVIVSIDWRTPTTILFALQANEWVVLLHNRKKEHQRPKARAKASYNGVLVEGNIDDWFCYLLNHLFCFGCLAAVICMYITVSRNHLKPIQRVEQQEKKRYNTCFHCKYYCVSLCSTCDVIRKTEENIRMQILAYLVSLVYHLNEFQKF